MNNFRVFAYRSTLNLGDAFQTYALARLLPGSLQGVFRDSAKGSSGPLFVANGYLADPTPHENALFAGVFLGKKIEQQIDWIRQSQFLIGARDPFTQRRLAGRGLASQMVGCATLTLPKYDGPRQGRIFVDTGHSNQLQQWNPSNNWRDLWQQAVTRLEVLRKAELVVTTKLHVVLPCLAMGTPVMTPSDVLGRINQPERFSILEEMGFIFGKEMTLNIRPWAENYCSFLRNQLNLAAINERDPEMPRVVS